MEPPPPPITFLMVRPLLTKGVVIIYGEGGLVNGENKD
jgi:hypothetical protein